MDDWQSKRTMTKLQFKRAARELGMNLAMAGRYIGVSPRTLRRMSKGEARVPTSAALLLHSLIAHGERPIVPGWGKR